MTKLTQKGVKFDWGDKQEAAFQLLKQKLCSAPILALPEGSEDFNIAYLRYLNNEATSLERNENPLKGSGLMMTIGMELPKQNPERPSTEQEN
ncbi:hypothetical protein Tco_1448730 [Tanacetum coccineum]